MDIKLCYQEKGSGRCAPENDIDAVYVVKTVPQPKSCAIVG